MTSILVLGDFSGRASRGESDHLSIKDRRRLSVDRDDLETRLEQLDVRVQLSSAEVLPINELDDFDPDRLLRSLSSLDRLLDIRARLRDPSTLDQARRELEGLGEPADEPAPEVVPEGVAIPPELLSAAIEEKVDPDEADPVSEGRAFVEQAVREAVAPYLQPKPDPRAAELIESVERAAGSRLRAALHDPRLRAVEAAWRGLQGLVKDLETGIELSIQMLDVSVEELKAASGSGGMPTLGRGGPDPDLVVLLHRFTEAADDMALLVAMAVRTASGGAMLVADGSPRLNGSGESAVVADPDDWASADEVGDRAGWKEARRAGAKHVALVVNRPAYRLLHGGRGAAVESIAFDEQEGCSMDDLPWGYGAWAVAHLFGRQAAFTAETPRTLDSRTSLENQPLLLTEECGEVVQVPCCEVLLGDRAAIALASDGLAVLRWERGTDRISIGPVASLGGEAIARP